MHPCLPTASHYEENLCRGLSFTDVNYQNNVGYIVPTFSYTANPSRNKEYNRCWESCFEFVNATNKN